MGQESPKLSQQEIDALLELMPKEGDTVDEARPPTAPAVNVRPTGAQIKKAPDVQLYDFRSPVKFSKEQVGVLHMVHETLAGRLTPRLSVYLRSKVQVTLSTLEQGDWTTFLANMSNPNIIHLVSLSPLPGRISLAIEQRLATIFLDRMLGGPGKMESRSFEMTSLNLVLIHKLVEEVLEELRCSWENIIELEPVIQDVTLNPLLASVAFSTESVLFALFDVSFHNISGTISIIIPFTVLDPIAKDLKSDMWGRGLTPGVDGANEVVRQQMVNHLTQIKVPISMRMTASSFDLEEIAHLRAGDVLLLDAHPAGLVKVFVGDEHKYWGRPGTVGNRMAVQITEVIRPEPPRLTLSEAMLHTRTKKVNPYLMTEKPPTNDDDPSADTTPDADVPDRTP